MSVPVYFNDPTSLLQKCAASCEYNHIIDLANNIHNDQVKRLAVIAVYSISMFTMAERINTKPFNPLLGETYELMTQDFQLIAEQVSHHPPITASYCKGLKTDYLMWTNQKTNTKF